MHRQIADLDRQIGELVEPLRPQSEPLTSIPGVDETAARDILAEIGTDRRRFGSSARLASWALIITHNFRELRERCKAWIISKEQLTTSFET